MNTIKHLPLHDYSGHEAETASGLHNVQAVDSDQRERRHRAAARGIAGCLILITAAAAFLLWALTVHAQLQPGPLTGNPDGTPYTGVRLPVYPTTYAPNGGSGSASDPILAAGNVAKVNTNGTPVPEPGTLGLWLFAAILIGIVVWMRRATKKSGLDLIWEERHRQESEEGWSAEHDDRHVATELFLAGRAYEIHALNHLGDGSAGPMPKMWPWPDSYWKPTDPIRSLVKAGALYLAEADRVRRLKRDDEAIRIIYLNCAAVCCGEYIDHLKSHPEQLPVPF